jgi:hypothetical protein
LIPGPYQIISCPHCKGVAKYRTLKSGNTLQSTSWSDGKRVSPMLPHPPAVVKCQHCKKGYWLTDAEKVGTLELWGEKNQKVNPEWNDAKQVEEPSEDEYYAVIEANLAKTLQQEKILRVLAWWRRNDTYRTKEVATVSLSDPCRDNLEALLKLMDQGKDEDRLMMGEILRELCQYEAAKQVLGSIVSAKYAVVVRQILSLCANEDTRVSELQISTK